MAAFHSLPKASLLALTNTGGVNPGDVYFANDTGETFLAMTGENGKPGIAPLSSLILTGKYALAGTPGADGAPGATGATGPAGPQGPAAPISQTIALIAALG